MPKKTFTKEQITLALRQVERGTSQSGPLGFGAAAGVGVDLVAAGLIQRISLQMQVLLLGRHAAIPDQHDPNTPANIVNTPFTSRNS